MREEAQAPLQLLDLAADPDQLFLDQEDIGEAAGPVHVLEQPQLGAVRVAAWAGPGAPEPTPMALPGKLATCDVATRALSTVEEGPPATSCRANDGACSIMKAFSLAAIQPAMITAAPMITHHVHRF